MLFRSTLTVWYRFKHVMKAEYHTDPHRILQDRKLAHNLLIDVEVLHYEAEFKSTASLMARPSGSDPDELPPEQEARLKKIFKDWAHQRRAIGEKALGSKRQRDAYLRTMGERAIDELTAKYGISREELERIVSYGTSQGWQ